VANRKQGKRRKTIVLAAGVFDVLHLGHVKFLEEAKKVGGRNAELIVIVARDRTVENRKGERPVISENQRRTLVESLKVVDEAILGYEEFDMGKVIEKINPDIIAVGHDQVGIGENVRKAVAERGLPTRIVKIGRFGEDELNSSSEIKKKIIEQYRRSS
jgi:FAD synthetase